MNKIKNLIVLFFLRSIVFRIDTRPSAFNILIREVTATFTNETTNIIPCENNLFCGIGIPDDADFTGNTLVIQGDLNESNMQNIEVADGGSDYMITMTANKKIPVDPWNFAMHNHIRFVASADLDGKEMKVYFRKIS